MKRWTALLLLAGVAGCSHKPCVEGEKVSSGWGYVPPGPPTTPLLAEMLLAGLDPGLRLHVPLPLRRAPPEVGEAPSAGV